MMNRYRKLKEKEKKKKLQREVEVEASEQPMRSVLNRSRTWSENRNPRELDAAERRNRMAEKVYRIRLPKDSESPEADSDNKEEEDWAKLLKFRRKRKSPEVTQEMLDRLEETKKRNDFRLPPTIEDLVREGMTKGKRHIYTTNPEYDDDRLKQQLERTMEHYVRPTDYYRAKERFCILEEREYQRDVAASGGFDVGFYPFLKSGFFSGQIARHYCPPVFNLGPEGVANLYHLASIAIQSYNSSMGTQYCLTNVIKAMRRAAQGLCYYITFEASIQDGFGNIFPLTFEARLFQWIPIGSGKIDIDFVRPKMVAGAGPSGFTQVPQYACCPSTIIPNSFPAVILQY
ncbi:uncharacterized protein LOC141706545 isoform X2 [Apium graveolens]|uniref:uncharacterized protein LOC141706545 isoform X2 n=1 Tax=Apium graveolens TaxID=4045 RepID=UPI003D7BEE6E